MNVPRKRSNISPNRPWGSWVEARPTFHEGEEAWLSDTLVPVAGEAYPPRFRVAVTCRVTDVTVCVPVRIERGGFVLPGIEVTPSCPEAFGEAVPAVIRGRAPWLARLIAMVPDSIEIVSDGSWRWVPAAWGWGGPTVEPGLAELDKPAVGSTPEQERAWAEQQKRERARLSEVKRRMSTEWHEETVPGLEEYAEYVRHRNWSRAELAAFCEKDRNISRAEAQRQVALAVELGLIPLGKGREVAIPLPRWNRWALEDGRTSGFG
ncbi:hypothetical protein [Kitasatospora sp. NPDC058218]|uniref:hypothetical protein n=1 Tax=Kitasatospora sp. NPDC058218 TaxID=3346385 RepID=UPI0036D7FEF1